MDEQLMSYAEMEVALRRTPEAVRQLVKRKRWRRIVGNDRRARIAVPTDFLKANVPDDTPPSVPDDTHTTPGTTSPSSPVADPDVGQKPTGSTGDARMLIEILQARVAELDGDLKQARTTMSDLSAKAGRVEVLEALLESERQRAGEWKATADRLLDQVEMDRGERERLLNEMTALHERMAKAEADRDRLAHGLATHLTLPWWRRLFA